MMTINISPETKIGKVVSNEEDTEVTIRQANNKLVTISKEKFQKLLDQKCTISANKVLYIKIKYQGQRGATGSRVFMDFDK